MRKRQKPYLLVTILLICGISVAVMNRPPSSNTPPPPPDQPAAGATDMHVPDAKAIGSDVSTQMQASQKQGGDKGGPPKRMPAPGMKTPPEPTGPLVVKPHFEDYKPKPNESATSTQWYTKDAAKSYSAPDTATKTPKESPKPPTN